MKSLIRFVFKFIRVFANWVLRTEIGILREGRGVANDFISLDNDKYQVWVVVATEVILSFQENIRFLYTSETQQ